VRLVRVRFKPHAPIWAERWAFAELIHKGARVEIARDGAWLVSWP
jgi:hypothetical protein